MANPILGPKGMDLPKWWLRGADTSVPTQPALPKGPGVPGTGSYRPNPWEFTGPKQVPGSLGQKLTGANYGVPKMGPMPSATPGVLPKGPYTQPYVNGIPTGSSSAVRFAGPGVEGMGDFAKAQPKGVKAPPGMIRSGLGMAGRMAGRIATNPITWAGIPISQHIAGTIAKNSSGGYQPELSEPTNWGGPISTVATSQPIFKPQSGISNEAPQIAAVRPLNIGYARPSVVEPAIPTRRQEAPVAMDTNWEQPEIPSAIPTTMGQSKNYIEFADNPKARAILNDAGQIERSPEWAAGARGGYAIGGGVSGIPATPAMATPNYMDEVNKLETPQSFIDKYTALQRGNTTWDMGSLAQIMAAKIDTANENEAYKSRVAALSHLGAAGLQADATRDSHRNTLLAESMKDRYMAPYYAALAKKTAEEAGAVPVHAQAEALKAMKERYKDDPGVQGMLKTLESKQMNPADFNDYARKIAEATRGQIMIPPMKAEG